MAKHGKKYRDISKLADESRDYSPEEAIELAKQASYAKFDESVELHLRMGVDPRNADQQVRGVVSLPHGLGKPVRIMVFAQGEAVKVAEDAGADYMGTDEMIAKIEQGWHEFDKSIATSDM
ncbi:MAG: 50S ribosomal protein L1, partial [Chloroflexota bacterium]|nr:50S ribosomal protein L1 [Chloroflexota bacterium]